MIKIAHVLAAWIGVEETLVLFSCFCVLAFLFFTRRLRQRSGFVRTLGRWSAFGPLALVCLLVLGGWTENSETIALLQSTGSLSESQANLLWNETYFGCATTFVYGLVATSAFVFFLRRSNWNNRVELSAAKRVEANSNTRRVNREPQPAND